MTLPRLRARAFLVALTLATAGLTTLAPAASASTIVNLVSSSSYVDSINYRHVVGEVRNDGTETVDFAQINLSYLDASDRLLKTDTTYPRLSPFFPGEKSPFETAFEPPAGYDHYRISVSPGSASAAPNRNFTSTVTNEYTDSIDYKHIVGTIRNNNSTTARFVQPIFTFYDANGVVVATESSYVKSNDEAALAPGASAPFEVTIDGDRAYSSYALATQSLTPPSTTGSAPAPTAGPSPTPSSSAPAPAPSPTQPAEQTPSVSIAPSIISAGQRVTVTYNGTPNTTLRVLSKTQPATEYSSIATAQLDANGFGTTSHAPNKNTRIMAQTSSGLSSVQPLIQVRSVASLNASRVATRTFAFTGRVYPARDQRLVSLYRNGVLSGQARTNASGVYTIRRTLTAGTANFQARTGNDTYNLGTSSPARSVRIY